MPRSLHVATLLVGLTLVLSGCTSPEAQADAPQPTTSTGSEQTAPPTPTVTPVTAAPTAPPTAAPQPTAEATLPKGVLIAGVDVGGLTRAEARKKLEGALQPLLLPLEVQAGDASATLRPEDIDLELPLDTMLAAAEAAQPGGRVELQVIYDEARLRAALGGLITQSGGPAAISVISSTKAISRSFALAGSAMAVDVDAAVKQLDERLRSVGGARRVTLPLVRAGAAARPTPAQLQEQIELMAKQWDGVAGIYVYDIASGNEIASLNKNTVFSAASTIKVAILLNAYAHVDSFTARQRRSLQDMVVASDNLAANTMLAAAVGGSGTEDALRGAEQMSAMLKELGLPHTYLYAPFEAIDYLGQKKIKIKLGPTRDGDPPYTDSGRALRTTPAEIAQIYRMVEQCSKGQGVLLEKFGKHLDPKRCQEMLDRLAQNGDSTRMRSGIPDKVRVEHKSGWIDDMQADAGIVRSPGGDFIVAIYLFQKDTTGAPLPDKLFLSVIGSFARLVYTYYNPVPLPDKVTR
jgi:beta-lactamase class A